MKRYSPTDWRNHGRPLKRLLDAWDRHGSISGPNPWKIYDDDDDDDDQITPQWNIFTQIGSSAKCWLDIYRWAAGLAVTGRICDVGQNVLQHSFQTGNSRTPVFLPRRNRPPPSAPRSPHRRGFMITPRHTTLGRTPMDGRSARSRELYLTTHNTNNRQTSMSPAAFEPAIPGSQRPQTHDLDPS